MPGNKRHTLKAMKGKDKLHPASRKAGQLDRIGLRTHKLARAGKRAKITRLGKLNRPMSFIHLLPDPTPENPLPFMTLPEFKSLITEHYLTRYDVEISELESARRPGRPKDKQLVEMEEDRRAEYAEWESGLEVVDLTDEGNCRLIRIWNEHDQEITGDHLNCLRMVRLTQTSEQPMLVREGKAQAMGLVPKDESYSTKPIPKVSKILKPPVNRAGTGPASRATAVAPAVVAMELEL